MRRRTASAVLAFTGILATLPAVAAKFKGSANLKDVQTTGMKDKSHKHQAYDLFFDAQGKSYTCRTDSGKSMNATDFVVGTQIRYEIDGEKVGIWSPENKKVGCKIVRVEVVSNPM
jgi:hypothetical protein